MSKMILGEVYTDGQVAALTRLADGPIGVEGIDPRTPHALVERDLCTESGGKLTLTPTGAEVVRELTGRAPKLVRATEEKPAPTVPTPSTKPKAEKVSKVRGGGRRKSDGPAKAHRERPAAPAARRPMTAQALRELRALVVAEHALELASIDKTIEIAEALPSDSGMTL